LIEDVDVNRLELQNDVEGAVELVAIDDSVQMERPCGLVRDGNEEVDVCHSEDSLDISKQPLHLLLVLDLVELVDGDHHRPRHGFSGQFAQPSEVMD
jgi:hypothetical protein